VIVVVIVLDSIPNWIHCSVSLFFLSDWIFFVKNAITACIAGTVHQTHFFSKHELCIAKKKVLFIILRGKKKFFFKEEGRPTFDHYIEYNYTIFS